jgi:DNA-binding NarL/FixJ family response regulator
LRIATRARIVASCATQRRLPGERAQGVEDEEAPSQGDVEGMITVNGEHTPAERLRVCAVDWTGSPPLYDRLADCAFDILAGSSMRAPREGDLRACDVVLAGCTEQMLSSPTIRRRVAKLSPSIAVVAVVRSPGPEAGLRAVQSGFRGVIAREVEPHAFRRAAEAAARGEIVLPRDAVSAVVRWIERLATRRRSAIGTLTPRQREVVDLIALGATDREIAAMLEISEDTAHKHVQNALRRANARRRSELVALMSRPPMPRPAAGQ